MKKVLFFAFCFLFLSSLFSQSLTKKERKEALKFIKWTTTELKNSVRGLSPAQLNFKPGPESWSPLECLYHIAYSEDALGKALEVALKAPADAETKASLKTTDIQIKNNIMDRSSKFKTATAFEPLNTGFKNFESAMFAFDVKRAMLVALVKNSEIDFRNHIVVRTFGKMDAYQFVLFIAGHTNRHTQQINEAKAIAGYPKK